MSEGPGWAPARLAELLREMPTGSAGGRIPNKVVFDFTSSSDADGKAWMDPNDWKDPS